MATTPVSEKILAEAKEQAEQVLAEAQEQVGQIQAQGKREFEELEESIQEAVGESAKQEEHRILAGARGAVTADILRAKHEVLKGVFRAAKESLGKMAEQEYRGMLSGWLKEAVESGNETVLAAEGEKHLDQGLVDQVNRELGQKGKLQLGQEKIPGAGGFMLQEGKVRTIATWEAVLTEARRELEPELCRILFADASAKP